MFISFFVRSLNDTNIKVPHSFPAHQELKVSGRKRIKELNRERL
jgi:hypothetical protein